MNLAEVRWLLAGGGLGMQVVVLALYLAVLVSGKAHSAGFRPLLAGGWSLGAVCLAVFAVYDHDVVLLLGQAVAWLVFMILIFKTPKPEGRA